MVKALDFNALKKRYLTVTLADEKNTKLMICTPTKAVLDSFLTIKDTLDAENIGDKAVNELYEIVAKLMSRNKGGIVITATQLAEIMDFEDMLVFIHAYTEFINEIVNSKN